MDINILYLIMVFILDEFPTTVTHSQLTGAVMSRVFSNVQLFFPGHYKKKKRF